MFPYKMRKLKDQIFYEVINKYTGKINAKKIKNDDK